jgi:hypothetical protein
MEAETLKVLGQVAGIGGIALGVMMILFRDVIQKSIFPTLSRAEGYRLLRLMIVATWTIALGGLGSWIYVKAQPVQQAGTGSAPLQAFTIAGLVTDAENNGLADVDVFVVGADDPVRTNAAGAFRLETMAPENSIVNVRISKAGFRARTENVKLPTSGLIVSLTATGPQPAPSPASDPATQEPVVSRPAPAGAVDRGRIYIRYAGDLFACSLGITFQLGDMTVVPTGFVYPVNNAPLGDTPYRVSGTIGCPAVGACSVSGSGRLNLRDEGSYSVIWQQTGVGQCDVRLAALP